MRARLLAAMGLGSLVGCPQVKQPTSTPVATDAAVASTAPAATVVTPDATAETPAVETVDAAPATVDAPTVATIDAGPKKKPPPGIQPLPPSAWYVSYPLANPPANYCKNGSAVCVPLEWAVKQNGKPGQATCPPEIVEACRCPAGMSCHDDPLEPSERPCPDSFHTVITQKQRAAGKKDACCYAQPVMCTPPWVGRALRDDDDAVLRASAQRRDDWIEVRPPVDDLLTEPQRAAVAAHYAEVAAGEHASIASFAHASLELMAHGAPPELLAGTHQAALDEIEHARLAYCLASEYGLESIGPGPLVSTRPIAQTLSELALSTLRDACIPEAIGAVLAAEVARAATVPAVCGAMKRIAEDEARHAELAFRTLAWTVRAGGPEVAKAVRVAVAEAEVPVPGSAPALPSHGLLGAQTERLLIAQTMTSVVLPCVAALLDYLKILSSTASSASSDA